MSNADSSPLIRKLESALPQKGDPGRLANPVEKERANQVILTPDDIRDTIFHGFERRRRASDAAFCALDKSASELFNSPFLLNTQQSGAGDRFVNTEKARYSGEFGSVRVRFVGSKIEWYELMCGVRNTIDHLCTIIRADRLKRGGSWLQPSAGLDLVLYLSACKDAIRKIRRARRAGGRPRYTDVGGEQMLVGDAWLLDII
jgi:hypothetical protein